MKEQEDAWNRADITAFMQAYAQDDSLLFIGKNGCTHGWQQTLKRYQHTYPDKAAMGTLQFENTLMRKLGNEHAFVVGRWTLLRESDTLSGYYSLLWELRQGKWQIIADHSS